MGWEIRNGLYAPAYPNGFLYCMHTTMDNTWISVTEEKENCAIENFVFSMEEHETNKLLKENQKCLFSPEFIPYYLEEVEKFWLAPLQWLLYWFIRFFLKRSEKFYFSNEDLAKILKCSEAWINKAIKKLKDKWLIDVRTKSKFWWWTIRFIVTIRTIDQWYNSIIQSDTDGSFLYKKNNNKENKKNIHWKVFQCLLLNYGLEKSYIQKAFEFKKSLDTIENMCRYIRDISEKYNMQPVYNKDTINATHIMWNKYELNNMEEFEKKLDLLWWLDYGYESYEDFIRQDYYLPNAIDNV